MNWIYWGRELAMREFRPREIEAITGHSRAAIRKWESLHDRFPRLVGSEASSAARWHSWQGVQMIAVFGNVMADLGNADTARAALMADPIPGITRGASVFEFDYRARELFAICDLSQPTRVFLTSGQPVPSMNRYYGYNISALQRDLIDRATSEGLLALAENADAAEVRSQQ